MMDCTNWAASPGTVTWRVRIFDYTDLMPDIQPGDIFVPKDCGLLLGVLLPVVSGVVSVFTVLVSFIQDPNGNTAGNSRIPIGSSSVKACHAWL
jgi:hypothetical protein